MAGMTKEEFLEILAQNPGSGIRQLARELGVNESTALNWVARAREKMPDAQRPATEQVKDAAVDRVEALTKRIQVLEHDLKFAKAKAKAAEEAELTAGRVREAIFGLAAETPAPPTWLVENRTGGSAPGVPVCHWSDWHYGEVVRASETGGANTYDTTVARARVRRLVDTTISLAYDHMVRPEYPGAVVCLGGDMVSGDIHEELAQTNEVSTLRQVNELADLLAGALDTMAHYFGNLFVPCVVGNHGRNTKRPRMKGRAFTNFDWLLYCLLERHFRKDQRIQFHVPEEADALFRVYGHRFLLTHGDALGVRGGDGIIGALGPIMRGRIKLANSEAQIGRDFDTLLMAHWHQHIALPGLRVNGTLKGYDEFSRLALRAPYQRPTQDLFFVHHKHGVTASWPVYLEPAPEGDAPWVSWRE